MCSSRKDDREVIVTGAGDAVTPPGTRFWLYGREPEPAGLSFESWASRLPQPANGGSGEGWNALLDAAELAMAVKLGLIEPSLAAEPVP